MGKHLQVLEVHQKVDTFEVLVGKKARFFLCYVIHKILDSLSNFVYVNEKFCNKNLFLLVHYCVGKFSQILYCLYNMYRDSSIELNALG